MRFSNPVVRTLLASSLLLISCAASSAIPTPERQATLKHLLIQDCGSCHGLRMKGGLGPALTPSDLAGKPKDSLVATIIYGRPGTAMPPWGALLNEQDATWMIEQLLQGVTP